MVWKGASSPACFKKKKAFFSSTMKIYSSLTGLIKRGSLEKRRGKQLHDRDANVGVFVNRGGGNEKDLREKGQ